MELSDRELMDIVEEMDDLGTARLAKDKAFIEDMLEKFGDEEYPVLTLGQRKWIYDMQDRYMI